jgi:hypothetical protein
MAVAIMEPLEVILLVGRLTERLLVALLIAVVEEVLLTVMMEPLADIFCWATEVGELQEEEDGFLLGLLLENEQTIFDGVVPWGDHRPQPK